jgi:hypothetical protein
VVSSMGNVLRQLQPLDKQQPVVPASQELEKVINGPGWPKPVTAQQPPRVFVYASPGASEGHRPGSLNLLGEAVWGGGHLYQVTGGGGGWGAKAGLLSLNPDTAHSATHGLGKSSIASDSISNADGPPSNGPQLTADLVGGDDTIWFIREMSPEHEVDAKRYAHSKTARKLRYWSLSTYPPKYCIGRLPLAGDDSVASSQEQEDKSYITGHSFGVLSHEAIGLESVKLSWTGSESQPEIKAVHRSLVDLSRFCVYGHSDPTFSGKQVATANGSREQKRTAAKRDALPSHGEPSATATDKANEGEGHEERPNATSETT